MLKSLFTIVPLLISFHSQARKDKSSWEKMSNQNECRFWVKENRDKLKQESKELFSLIKKANQPISDSFDKELKLLNFQFAELDKDYLKLLNNKENKIVTMHTALTLSSISDIERTIFSFLDSKYLNYNNTQELFEKSAPQASAKINRWVLLGKKYEKSIRSIEETIMKLRLDYLEKKLANIKNIVTQNNQTKIMPPPRSCMGYEKKFISYFKSTFFFTNLLDEAIDYLLRAEVVESHKFLTNSISIKRSNESIEAKMIQYASLPQIEDKQRRRGVWTEFITQFSNSYNNRIKNENDEISKEYLKQRDLNELSFIKPCEDKTKAKLESSHVNLGKKLDNFVNKSCRNMLKRARSLLN